MLEVKNLSYHYQNQLLFHSVNFSALRGDVTVILGPSGVGKTTLFRIIAGLTTYSEGEVLWEGGSISQNHVSYMQQKVFLLAWRTVWKNMWLIYELDKGAYSKENFSHRLDRVIHHFQLTPLLSRFPDELSEGQKQRIALAMQCLSRREVLLLDEPFSSLDVVMKEELYAHVRSLAKNENKAVLLITHDIRDVMFLGDALFVIRNQTIHRVIIPTAMKDAILADMHALMDLFKTYIFI